MTIVKCDRCGAEIQPEAATIVDISTYKDRRTVEPKRYELCDECMKRLNNWLDAIK